MSEKIKMIRGTVNKTATIYTLAFIDEAQISRTLPEFKKMDCTKVGETKKTANGFELKLKASDQGVIRTALRAIKKTGVAVYRGSTPAYLRENRTTPKVIKLAKSLPKAIAKVVKKDEPKKIEAPKNSPKAK